MTAVADEPTTDRGAQRDWILSQLPEPQREPARTWFALCEELGMSPSATLGRYCYRMFWKSLTRNWWDRLADFLPVNWDCLTQDTKRWGKRSAAQ